MDYIDALKFFYDRTSTCPDKKTIPSRRITKNTLEMICKNWKLVIEKEERTNVYNILQTLLDKRDYKTYDKYVKVIIDIKKNIDKLNNENTNKIKELNLLYNKRENLYTKIDNKKLSIERKEKLAAHYKKYGLNNLSKFNQNEKNYLTWFDTCIDYLKLQNKENNFKEIDRLKKQATEYITKKGTVKETSSTSLGKK